MSLFDITRLQPRAWSVLARSFTAGRTASTYLFHGREGMGGWSLALSLAALVNCARPATDADDPVLVYPCGECPGCRAVASVNHESLRIVVPIKTHRNLNEAIDLTNEVIDYRRKHPLRLLDQAQPVTLPIDMAREVKRSLSIKGAPGVTRVALFYHMDLMRMQSADALLKLIEEPPPNTVIIMTASRPEMLLPTIRSRSQKVRLHRVAEPLLINYLIERHGVSEAQAKLAARISEGVPGLALAQLNTDDEEANGRGVGLMLFRSLIDDSGPETVSQITELLNMNDRQAVADLLRLWQSLLRDCACYAASGEEADLVNVDFQTEIKRLSVPFGSSALVQSAVELIKNTLADMLRNVHIQPALVALVLKLKADIAAARGLATQEVQGG
ncbi:hypothetical protein GF377_05425 [candidate division GN15 bacterium]|nr:hypothetical protein [candidate division GN15 bacterium]